MRKIARRAPLFLCLLLAGIFFSRSQQQRPAYPSVLALYADAQRDYDSATLISHRTTYGTREEQWEEALNASALKKFQRLFAQLPRDPRFDSLRFFTSFKVGELQHYFENYADAVNFYRTAIEVGKNTRLPDSLFFKPYLYSGIIYYNQNKFDSALQYFRIAESVQKKYNNGLQEGERLYNIVGVLYYERGNYRQAENYFQKAIEVLSPQHEAYKNLYVNYHINLAQIYLKLEDYDKANSIYQKLLPLNIMTNEIYHNIGSLNLSLGAATKALVYFRKVRSSYNKAVRLYNSMGNAFFASQQYDSANIYYQKAIQAYHAQGKNSDPAGYGSVLKSLGAYALNFEQYDSALLYYQQALRQFYPSFTATGVETNPEKYSGVFSYINLFQTLADKAEAWHRLYQKTTRLSAAQQELATYQSAFRLIDYVERTYESDEARLFLAKIKYILHSKPVSIAYILYTRTEDRRYLDALYLFDQQNKATALVLSRQLSDTLRMTHSPLLQKEQELKSVITLSS
ncbi:MAG TPA: tetratricopeptide repeat protein, partial [Flavisolibacter sp.]|nr:tetratricopeptide repeat protein [Flavisolibacter sp.]